MDVIEAVIRVERDVLKAVPPEASDGVAVATVGGFVLIVLAELTDTEESSDPVVRGLVESAPGVNFELLDVPVATPVVPDKVLETK